MQRMQIMYMAMYHEIKEHIGVTGKRTELFAAFPKSIMQRHIKQP